MKRARVLVADPPWQHRDKLPGKRGAAHKYKTLPLQEICTFDLPPLADDCWLFLWRLSSMPLEGLSVVKAWGFEPYSEIVWRKMRKDGNAPRMGMGRSVRNCHEVAIIARRGRPKRLRADLLSVFDAPLPINPQTGRFWHSAKPERFREIVESFAPGPYVELFARTDRHDWSCFGDQLGPAG